MMSWWQSFAFREPLWLLLCLQPVLLLAITALIRRTRRDEYADAALLPWAKLPATASLARRIYPHVFLLLAWIAFAVAAAGPRRVEKIIDTDISRATEVIVVLDLSHSMAARDVLPSRIERAKIELNHFVQHATGLRIGLVVFAAQPHLICPPTADKQVLQHYLTTLHTGLLPTEGSDVSTALAFAAKQLHADVKHSRALLLLSDGETNLLDAQHAQRLRATVTELAQQAITLFILGIGTQDGAAIPDKEHGWLQYQGQPVITRLNPDRLTELATLGNGRYATAVDDDNDWLALYDRGIALLAATAQDTIQTGNIIVWHEQYGTYLLTGVFFLLLASWQFKQRPAKQVTRTLSVYGAILLSGFLLTRADPLHASEATLDQAYRAYQRGDYPAASKLYSQIAGFAARMGEGDSAYQRHDYKIAAMHFIQATLDARTDSQRADALFNLANSYYKLQAYAQAAPIYQDVLRYRPGFDAAQVNLAYAQTLFQQQQIEEAIKAKRAGRGPSTARVAEDVPLDTSRLSLDNATPQQAIVIAPPANQTITPTDTSETLRQTQPATESVDNKDDTAWTYSTHRVEDIQRQASAVQADDSVLWQRLFEQEENFPAPVITPHVVPQVPPW
jgi:Ca-activated chloride channel family protein